MVSIGEFLGRYTNFGLMILRLGVGILIIGHGIPNLIGGPAEWQGLGESVSQWHIPYVPLAVWGFLASAIQVAGGVCVIIGFLFLPAVFLLSTVMGVALMTHLRGNDGFVIVSHAALFLVVFFSLIFVGPGEWTLNKK